MRKDLSLGSGFRKHHLVVSVNLAEAIAMLHGIQFASDMGFLRVILESDSKVTINHLKSPAEDYSEMRPITGDVKAWAIKFIECRFEYTGINGNLAAHVMAKEGMRHLSDRVEDAPARVKVIADSDCKFCRPP